MERFVLDSDTADRLLSGALNAEDAPPRYSEVAALLQAAAFPTTGGLDGEAATVAAVVDAISSGSETATARRRPRRRTLRTKAKIAAAGLVGALTLGSGLAAANALPGSAQRVASDALDTFGVHVPKPKNHKPNKPEVRGKSDEHPAETGAETGKPDDNKGAEISDLARTTDATGADKGAVISDAASEGKSHAGEEHGPPSSKPATPNGPPTSTPAADNSHAPPVGGNSTADEHRSGRP